MRRIVLLLTSLLMCFSLSLTASAQNVPTSIVQPYYENTCDASAELYINGTTAICESTLRGFSNVTKIVAVQTLQKQGFLWMWSTYDNTGWTKTVYASSLLMSNTKMGLSSGNYRLKTVFTVTNSAGKVENITVYSNEEKIP